MLARTLFVIALLVILAQVIVTGAAAMARATLHRRAVTAAETQAASGVQAAQAAIAAQVARSGAATALQNPPAQSACAVATTRGCAMTAAVSVAFVTPAPSGGPSCPETACTVYDQHNDAIAERRADAIITSTIRDLSATTVATRSQHVVFRVFDQAPYAALSGVLDGSASGVGAPGNDGGAPATLLHVQYRNAATGAITSGDVWNANVENASPAPPAWDP